VASTRDAGFRVVAERPIDRGRTRVYEHGWQSWSPAGLYPVDLVRSPRPHRRRWQTMAFRPEAAAPDHGFQGEGLLGIVEDDATTMFLAPHPERSVPSIRAQRIGDRLVVSADGPVDEIAAPDLARALSETGTRLAERAGVARVRALGPGWCSWYGYGPDVTDRVIESNLAAIDRHALRVDLIQVDDGYQAAIGDWLQPSGRLASLGATAARIRDTGREAGIWTAPFVVRTDARLAQEHPDWLVGDALASDDHWGGPVRVLDVTHPDAAAHLVGVFRQLTELGYTFHKIDFLYGGAMQGTRHGQADPIAAYREGLRLIREGVGPASTILACGAPLLPSIGLVDAMRVSPDVDRASDPPEGDPSQPGARSALAAGRARAWTHGRLWVADPDCLITDPAMPLRQTWAEHLAAFGGLSMSGDRLPELDAAGLASTRALLRPSRDLAAAWDPDAGPDGGRLRPGEVRT
jgi:alpha-galactosidase